MTADPSPDTPIPGMKKSSPSAPSTLSWYAKTGVAAVLSSVTRTASLTCAPPSNESLWVATSHRCPFRHTALVGLESTHFVVTPGWSAWRGAGNSAGSVKSATVPWRSVQPPANAVPLILRYRTLKSVASIAIRCRSLDGDSTWAGRIVNTFGSGTVQMIGDGEAPRVRRVPHDPRVGVDLIREQREQRPDRKRLHERPGPVRDPDAIVGRLDDVRRADGDPGIRGLDADRVRSPYAAELGDVGRCRRRYERSSLEARGSTDDARFDAPGRMGHRVPERERGSQLRRSSPAGRGRLHVAHEDAGPVFHRAVTDPAGHGDRRRRGNDELGGEPERGRGHEQTSNEALGHDGH